MKSQNGLTSQSTCNPQHPIAFMMEALCITRYAMPLSFALNTRSVCVVALKNPFSKYKLCKGSLDLYIFNIKSSNNHQTVNYHLILSFEPNM